MTPEEAKHLDFFYSVDNGSRDVDYLVSCVIVRENFPAYTVYKLFVWGGKATRWHNDLVIRIAKEDAEAIRDAEYFGEVIETILKYCKEE